MRTPQTKVIEGLEYTVTPLGAGAGFKVLTELVKMFGPIVENVQASRDIEALLRQVFGIVAERLDGDVALAKIIQPLAEQSTVQTEPTKRPVVWSVFDVHFAGNYAALGEFVVFALEVNFRDFFRQLAAKLPKRQSADAPPPQTATASATSTSFPTTSSPAGPSGASQVQGDFRAR